MAKEDWGLNSVWDKKLPDLGEKNRKNLDKSGSLSVRKRKGLFYTNEEFEKERKRIIKKIIKYEKEKNNKKYSDGKK